MMDEIWLPIKGYEGSYEVSNLGRVRSLDGMVTAGHGSCRLRKGRILKPRNVGNKETQYFAIQFPGVGNKRIHRLVASAFIPNPDAKEQVNHKDGNKKNNCVENLEWVTAAENQAHAFATGLKVMPKGVEHYCAKLTPELVRKVRFLKKLGYSQVAIGKEVGVSQGYVWKIVSGKTWKHIV
jgi:hypothetical protein